MTSRCTKEPRLTTRFPDFEIIDAIEIAANRQGIKKNAWVRRALEEKLERDRGKHLLEDERLKGEFESRKLLQMMAPPEMVEEAKAYVADYLRRMSDHARSE